MKKNKEFIFLFPDKSTETISAQYWNLKSVPSQSASQLKYFSPLKTPDVG